MSLTKIINLYYNLKLWTDKYIMSENKYWSLLKLKSFLIKEIEHF
jgi:hypothetical protein